MDFGPRSGGALNMGFVYKATLQNTKTMCFRGMPKVGGKHDPPPSLQAFVGGTIISHV